MIFTVFYVVAVFSILYDRKDPSKAGRLRLMYEANPMSMLIEQAGGASTTGRVRILDIQPTEFASTCACRDWL